MRLLLTADPGLEDVAASEAGEKGYAPLATRPHGYGGLLLVEGEGPAPLLSLRSVHHVAERLGEGVLPGRGLEDALSALLPLDLPELAAGASFAVRVHRRGEHAFRSPELERALGARLVARYGAPVDLENPDLLLRVDLFQDRFFVSRQLTRRPLSRRYPKVYAPPAALKTTVAYGLLRLMGVRGPGRLLDAFTGSGTIAIEAAQAFPDLEVMGLDKNPRAVEGARANAAAAGVTGVRFFHGDARRLEAFEDESLDYLTANPPYGRRLGRQENLRALYARFLAEAERVLRPGGRLGLLVQRRGWIDPLLRKRPALRRRHVRVVELGGLFVGLFVLERR